jgi:hypothetical protein
MSNPLSPDGPKKLLASLRCLVADRAPAEREIPARYRNEKKASEQKYQGDTEEAKSRYEHNKSSSEEQYVSARRALVAQFEAKRRSLESEYRRLRTEAATQFSSAEKEAKRVFEESRWEANTIFEATKKGPPEKLEYVEKQVAAGRGQIQSVFQSTTKVLRRRWQWRHYPEPEPAAPPSQGDPLPRFVELIQAAHRQSQAVCRLTIPGLFEGARPLGFLLLLWLLAIAPSILIFTFQSWQWIVVSIAAAVVLWIGLGIWLYLVAKGQTTEGFLTLHQTLVDAEACAQRVLQTAKATYERETAAIQERLQTDLKRAEDTFRFTMQEAVRRRDTLLQQGEQKYPPQLTELTVQREQRLDRLEEEYARRVAEIDSRHAQEMEELQRDYAQRTEEIEQTYQRAWNEMADQWQTGMGEFQNTLAEMNRACADTFLDWSSSQNYQWKPATESPPSVPFGRIDVRLGQVQDGLPEDEKLVPQATDFSLPALVPFPNQSLLIKADGDGRDRAVDAMRAIMLRMLIAVPPGKVRFTIIDPVGLGENFSAFMHLADYDEKLVTNRIWTEGPHIEQRLADLTEHMENVLQVYLRNEFQTIQEYNSSAGEMAEAYRVLVVANFPAGFTEAASQRLLSIVSSGARCGVHTLITVDTKMKLPHNFHLSDLEANSVNLRWKHGRFVWEDPDMAGFPLELDRPPSAGAFTELVKAIGSEARDAERVEVPFDCIVPQEGNWWAGSTETGVDLPLGRAGAMKLQHLGLGKGTSQHVLISGKTGSGKSNLLHAIITNAALWYGPDQIQMYLVDFKKGVEFKAYTGVELPHVRVVAIESEREFGLSVLERLDLELKLRGDRFRALGVQDLPGFRAAEPEAVLPRLLLIIDEFQELFVEDDRIAQNASLLLDRLVRQGRAFGIHVILGSQTLAGSYSLPRATIGQMAVRIALQCSEADAHLILSEENTAARLLTRPGEAIYNDANGLVEGNHPFQVVWLPDRHRDRYLKQLDAMSKQHKVAAEPAIVFEGNAPADLSRNPQLRRLMQAPNWPETVTAPQAWLGAAVAIKDPTSCEFHRQGGSNLLLVGHREEAALGILASCILSLAAQIPTVTCTGGSHSVFYVLDGTRPDAPEAGWWQRLADSLPHTVKIGGPRDAADLMAEIAAELARRQEADADDAMPCFLMIYNLSRFRDLRKAEDDFGFGRMDEDKPPSPSKQFAEILKEGPPLGLHSLVWCDTYNNLNRSIDRQGLRDLELRVAFQMSDVDSSNLIDSPEAGRIGIHRAVLYNEGLGELEKFRPYGLPPSDWLAWVAEQLKERGTTPAVDFQERG